MTPDEARTVSTWRYPPPYDLYNVGDAQNLLTPEYRYHAVLRGDELVGFFCLGLDAQVPGGTYTQPGLDLGLGMRPDLTGQGLGGAFLRAILDTTSTSVPLRLTVAAFNERAQRLYAHFGFRTERTFVGQDGLEYVQMTRPSG